MYGVCILTLSINVPIPFSAQGAPSPVRQLPKLSYLSFGQAVQSLISARMLASDFVCGPDRVRRDDSWGEPVLYERRLDIEIRRQVFVSLGLKEGDTIDLKMMFEALEVAKARAAERPPVPLADFEVKAFGIVCHYLLKVAADQGAADGESLIVLPADPDLDLENKAWPVVGNGGGPAGWPALPPIWPSVRVMVPNLAPSLAFQFCKPGDKIVVHPLASGHGGSP